MSTDSTIFVKRPVSLLRSAGIAMRSSSWSPCSAGNTAMRLSLAWFATVSHAISFTPAPPANLDLSNLGRVGLVGDFDAISLYEFEGQSEAGVNTNGSHSILAPYPNGGFATIQSADAGISTMCSYMMSNGTMAGVVVGGNFTSLGGVESPGVALFNPKDSSITPLLGLSGQVYALLCDEETETVYVGGNFKGSNSTNAIAWYAGWVNLPFTGLNGPVTSITKAPNGKIIFGGSFTGLGNASAPVQKDMQVINIAGAEITATSSSTTPGFSDPKNIVCKSGGVDGPDNTWLLADASPGRWEAKFGHGFEPTKLRLWNTHLDGRGTKTFHFRAWPDTGIMNFTFVDPDTGRNATCSSECPLSNNVSVEFQDFHFVNTVGMDAFRMEITDWYGSGAGLNGISLFQDDIFAYAVNNFNEPTCAGLSSASIATTTGPWNVENSHDSTSDYLLASLTDSNTAASVVFSPDIKQSGNYSVNLYTPGCLGDATCTSRGQVRVTGTMSNGNTFDRTIFQTNNFPKYDQIYFGYVDSSTGAARPSVTLTPVADQGITPLTVVANRVGFTLISSDGGLNGVFEYDPTQAVVETSSFSTSVYSQAGMEFNAGSGINAMLNIGGVTYMGGNFTAKTSSNILAIDESGPREIAGAGLNGEVASMYANGSMLYVAGQFSNAKDGGVSGLSNIAAYDTNSNSWKALGAGVNGQVYKVIPLNMNITEDEPEKVITFSGNFTELLAADGQPSIAVDGFAVWVASRGRWLQNLDGPYMAISGQLTAYADIPDDLSIVAGSLRSAQLSSNGVVGIGDRLSTFPIRIQAEPPQTSVTLRKRATNDFNISGVATGLFYDQDGVNITILGGHFTARTADGTNVSNLALIDGSASNAVRGVGSELSSDSTILALNIHGSDLYAGGSLSAEIDNAATNGLISYNLEKSAFNVQPPSLSGGSTIVYAITTRPDSDDIYVGGDFTDAGSLDCPGVCAYSQMQWNRPGTGLSGVTNAMLWTSTNTLVVGGLLELNGANVSLATYDVKAQSWSITSDETHFPGPVTALTAGNKDSSHIWAAGRAANGSTFLVKHDGQAWVAIGDVLGSNSNVRGLQMFSLERDHDETDLMSSGQVLMITGALNIPGFGNASAALYNGTSVQPYVLTSTASNRGGSIAQIFSERSDFFKSSRESISLPLKCISSFPP